MSKKKMIYEEYEKCFLEIEDEELFNLLACRRGGVTSIRIIDQLLKKPCNKNQLSETLDLDYNTITYHIELIGTDKYLKKNKIGKIKIYSPSDKLINNIKEYYLIKELLEKK